ncbi:hypothetical protein PSY31_23230, partial [Shigella flexneri]|nr:hypothetical protein [Shigella flexneri]
IDLTYLSKLRVSRYRYVLSECNKNSAAKHITSCFIFVDETRRNMFCSTIFITFTQNILRLVSSLLMKQDVICFE